MFDNRSPKKKAFRSTSQSYIVGCLLVLSALVATVNGQEKTGPGYIFLITIHPGGTSSVSVLSGYETLNLDASGVQKAILEYRQLQDRAPKQPYVEPRIVVHPHSSVDIRTLSSVIRSARVSAGTDVKVNLSRGPVLMIERAGRVESGRDVRPDPRTLVLTVDPARVLSLNGKEQGTVSASAGLIETLRAIYKAREDNGVFRDGTNEVEKTIFIKMYPGSTVAELETIATTLEAAGSDRIGLQVDDLEDAVPTRPPIAPPTKPE